jgi:hypothetical protein
LFGFWKTSTRLRGIPQLQDGFPGLIRQTFEKEAPTFLEEGMLTSEGRMGFTAPFRTFLSMLLLAAVVFAAATGECAACGFSQGARMDTRECCQPDGSCDMASNMAGCMKSHATRPAVLEQAARLPQASVAGVKLAVTIHTSPVISPDAAAGPRAHIPLINLALLI